MSGLRFFLGRANSGRTDALYQAVLSHMARGERAVLVVPEQATFAAERRLAAGGKGLIGVQVLSVERLSERILENSSRVLPYLSQQGLSMTTRRVAERNVDTLRVFARAVRQRGFCTELSELFSEMKRAAVTPEALAETAARLPEGSLLSDKLHDLSLLYGETCAYLDQRYLTLDDRMNAAIRLLPASFLQGAYVYFDGLPAQTRQLEALMAALLDAAQLVTVGLADDPEGKDEALFFPSRRAYARLSNLARERGLPVETRRFSAPRGGLSPVLSHLEANLFSYPCLPYGAEAAGVTLYGAVSRHAEAEAVADAILAAARGGLRYRDMAVVVSDPQVYGAALRRSLSLREIPFFLDAKRPVQSHAAAELVQGALSAVSEGFAPEQMLRLAKCGYGGVAREDAEALENYVLRFGLRGSAFLAPFRRGEDPAPAERARAALMEPLLALREGLHGRTVREKLTALYAYLTQVRLPEQLEARATLLLSLGRPVEAEEHAQLWRVLTELFDQLYAILGDAAMGRDDFLGLIEEGFASCTVGVIPDTADRVLVGDPVRTRLPGGVKKLFLMGANEGMLPRERGDDGLIDSRELTLLEQQGLPVWNRQDYAAALDTLRLYELVSSAAEGLFLSYSFASDEGELAPAPLVHRLRRALPQLAESGGAAGDDALPSCERTGLRRLAESLREDARRGGESPMTAALLAHFLPHPAFGRRAAALAAAAQGRVSPAPVEKSLAAALYGTELRMSASRLEQFNACPFRHFVRYGLGALVRPEAKEGAAEYGSFFHAALEAFLRRCLDEKLNFKTLSEDRIALLLDEILPTVLAAHNDGLFLHNERLRAGLFLVVDTLRQSAAALVRQLAAGSFVPMGTELRFGEGGAFPAIALDLGGGRRAVLSGVIDRVDRADTPEGTLLRVIDYKTGGRRLDYGAILEGLTLQLPLYLAAATALSGTPAGMYYMPVRVAPPAEDEDVAEALQKQFRLAGVTLSDPRVMECTEGDLSGTSGVLAGVRRRQDGSLSGALCGGADMLRLLDRAKEIAARTGRAMLAGEICVSPAEGACQYCDYRSVCRFDTKLPSCRVRRRRRVPQEDFFAMLGGETHAVD